MAFDSLLTDLLDLSPIIFTLVAHFRLFSNQNFFFCYLSSKVRTRIEPEPNAPNAVLSVLVRGSACWPLEVRF